MHIRLKYNFHKLFHQHRTIQNFRSEFSKKYRLMKLEKPWPNILITYSATPCLSLWGAEARSLIRAVGTCVVKKLNSLCTRNQFHFNTDFNFTEYKVVACFDTPLIALFLSKYKVTIFNRLKVSLIFQ